MTDLFDDAPSPPTEERHELEAREPDPDAPLADRMRPRTIEEMVGQADVTGEGTFLREAIEADRVPSLVLWGPPGSGKTTLALAIARRSAKRFRRLSAVTSGVRDVREVIAEARDERRRGAEGTLLFVDEIHRFNKAQQDAFLPHVESGLITLLGATTENPSFEVIPPLLSRCRVVPLEPLGEEAIRTICRRALEADRGLGRPEARLAEDALELLGRVASGDARTALNVLEGAVVGFPDGGEPVVGVEEVARAAQRPVLATDRTGDRHYDLISALHKAIRASDPDASVYWLARMLEAGEDPLYVGRRLVRAASEDVGLADPEALRIALDAVEAVKFVGLPEASLALTQAATYLALAPKSNALYRAWEEARRHVRRTGDRPVPLCLRNAPTDLLRDVGAGEGYRYAHDHLEAVAPLQCFPDGVDPRTYYRPTDRGRERRMAERLEEIRAIKRAVRDPDDWRPDAGPGPGPRGEGAGR